MDNETIETHESYGLLQISRVSGSHKPLFGSSLKHGSTIRVCIRRAALGRHLSHDWYYGREELVEVELSATQFAEAITTINSGSGTPCTILHVERKAMQECPDRTPRQQINDEFKIAMQTVAAKLEEATQAAKELLARKSLTKVDREVVLAAIARLNQEVASNIPFIHHSFDEAMDKTVMEAKGEIEAFYTHAVLKAGREALGMVQPEVPMLEEKRQVD